MKINIFEQRRGLRHVIVLIAALCVAVSACAESVDQLVDVVSTGYGMTVREAARAALRAAVEQVVGTMVDATTLVENDELIENEILLYSPGMIAESHAVGEPKKTKDGVYSVKVKATVRKGQIHEKLRAASAVNVAIDGADLFARMIAAKDNLADAEAMIRDVLSKHTACVIAEAVPGKSGNSPIDLDPKTGEVFANVRVRIDQTKYTQFANEVVEKIGPMSTSKIKLKASGGGGKAYRPDGACRFAYDDTYYSFFVMTNFRSGSAVAFKLDKNTEAAVFSCLDTGSLAVSVTLCDVQGEEIVESSKALNVRCLDSWGNNISIFGVCWGKNGMILPFYEAKVMMYNCKGHTIEDGANWTGECRISLGKFSPEELKSVGKLKVKVGHMKAEGQFID